MATTTAVFFDVANTLLCKPGLYGAIIGVLADAGIDIPREELALRHRLLSEAVTFPDRTSAEFYARFNAQLLRSLGVAAAPELVQAIHRACSYLPWAAFDDVVHLASIRQPMGVLSNWDRSLQQQLQALSGVSFRWILGSEEQQMRKPDPGFYARMLEAAGCPADEIVYVGDSIELDIEPAQRLGVRAWLLDRDGLYAHGNLPRLRSLADIGSVL